MAETWAAGLSWEGSGVSCSPPGDLVGWAEFWGGPCAGSEGLGHVACENVGGHPTSSVTCSKVLR